MPKLVFEHGLKNIFNCLEINFNFSKGHPFKRVLMQNAIKCYLIFQEMYRCDLSGNRKFLRNRLGRWFPDYFINIFFSSDLIIKNPGTAGGFPEVAFDGEHGAISIQFCNYQYQINCDLKRFSLLKCAMQLPKQYFKNIFF